MGVPYCIVKGKAKLGNVVHKKTATALALVDVHPEDKQQLATLVTAVKSNYFEKADEIRKTWGGGIMGFKSQQSVLKKEKAKAKAAAQAQKA
jgi:large subunit ribosomal protein L7Ae